MSECPYKDRRREGDTVLRQCQLTQLYLLHVLDDVCKKHAITYYLIGGTALGAARHDGFIPWDDDLDVGMPMADYRRFIKIAAESLPEGVKLQTPVDTPFAAIPFAKLRDLNSFYCEVRPDVATSDPSGIYIDIFPNEEMPALGRSFQKFVVLALSSSWMRTRWFFNKTREGLWQAWLYSLAGFSLAVVHGLLRLWVTVLQKTLPCDRIFNIFESGYIHSYKKDWVCPLTTHRFEDADFPVPNDLDKCLTSQYGDWRQVPPPEKRPRHATIIDPFHSARG